MQDAAEDLLTHPEDNAEEIARLTELGAITVDGDADDDELYHCACYVASLTLEVLEELFTSARQLMAWMAQCARLVAQHDQPVSWITPLGLPVVQPYRRGRTLAVRWPRPWCSWTTPINCPSRDQAEERLPAEPRPSLDYPCAMPTRWIIAAQIRRRP